MNTIGKLLWNKAVKAHANYERGTGVVIIEVPVVMNYNSGGTTDYVEYQDLKQRVNLAVIERLFKGREDLKRRGFGIAEASVMFSSQTNGTAIITFKTHHLDVWQWVRNNKFSTP